MDPSHKARILDMTVIDTLKSLGGDDEPELFIELVDLFLEDARGNFEALSRALDEVDAVLHLVLELGVKFGPRTAVVLLRRHQRARRLQRLPERWDERGGEEVGRGPVFVDKAQELFFVRRQAEARGRLGGRVDLIQEEDRLRRQRGGSVVIAFRAGGVALRGVGRLGDGLDRHRLLQELKRPKP